MHGDGPDQSGASGRGYYIERCGVARLAGSAPMSRGAGAPRHWAGTRGSAVRACFAMVFVIVSLPVPARGQPKVDASREIPVHPSVTTILQLPDDVELARFTGSTSGMMQATTLREFLYIQPRADLEAGTEVVLYVKTATLRRRFRLRVVEHARDAWENVMVLEPEAEPAPAASASTGAPAPAAPEGSGRLRARRSARRGSPGAPPGAPRGLLALRRLAGLHRPGRRGLSAVPRPAATRRLRRAPRDHSSTLPVDVGGQSRRRPARRTDVLAQRSR
jgi:hypothetical protein